MIELTTGVTQQQLTDVDHQDITYKGVSVFDLIYEQTNYGGDVVQTFNDEGNDFTGQETYLGYSPSQNAFYMAVEGDMSEEIDDGDDDYEERTSVTLIIQITSDGNAINCKVIDTLSGLFYGSRHSSISNFKRLHKAVPDLLDIRLD